MKLVSRDFWPEQGGSFSAHGRKTGPVKGADKTEQGRNATTPGHADLQLPAATADHVKSTVTTTRGRFDENVCALLCFAFVIAEMLLMSQSLC